MNPIASVIARIDAIESRFGEAIAVGQARAAQMARSGRTVGEASLRTASQALPTQDAATTFADALATAERAVSTAITRSTTAAPPTTSRTSLDLPAGTQPTATASHDAAVECRPAVTPPTAATSTAASTDASPNTASPTAATSTAPVAGADTPTPVVPAAESPATVAVAAGPADAAVADAGEVAAAPATLTATLTPVRPISSEALEVPATTPVVVATPTNVTAPPPSHARPVDGLPSGADGGVGPVPYATDFEAAAARHGVPSRLLAAMAWVESRYQPTVVAERGAVGMMQLMPETAATLGVDPLNPAASIDGAARLMAGLYDRFGSWDLALAAYNTGVDTVTGNGNQATPRGVSYTGKVFDRLATMEVR